MDADEDALIDDAPTLPTGGAGAPTGPLAGITVVDLSQMLAGPFATMLLADLGADVVKVEPTTGDPARRFGPFHEADDAHHFGGYFQSINRGKRSVAVDLKRPEGRELVEQMATAADVVVENFRAGVMDRLGLGYEHLAERNPRLVYGTIRGFGDPRTGSSPLEDWPAFDLTAQAMGGFLSITGLPDQPVKSGPGIGDIFPGTLLALGVVSAVQERERSGLGQFVDVAMFDAVLALSERLVHQHSYTGTVPVRAGNEHPFLSPFDVLPTADGHVTIASPSDGHWVALAELMGTPELATDARYATNEARLAHAAEVRALCGRWASAPPPGEGGALLAERVPVGPVNDMADIAASPHTAAREMVVELPHPGLDAPVAVAGAPIKLTRTPTSVTRRAPLLGEHTRTLAASLGRTDDEIDELLATGVLAEEVVTHGSRDGD